MDLITHFKNIGSVEKVEILQRFFKTNKGEYGEGDVFLGINMPTIRAEIKAFYELGLDEIQELLNAEFHEVRMAAVLILNEQMKHKDNQKAIFDFYLQNAHRVNNWDLVDCSAHLVVGRYLFDKNREILTEMAYSNHLWTQRIAMVSTWHFIRKNDVQTTIELAEIFLQHKHDLMHKATGWMLREGHKRVPRPVVAFLEKYRTVMPRTMLRYAIEKFPEEERKRLMSTT